MGLGVSMVSGYLEMSCADNGFVLSFGLASTQNLMKCVWRPAGITLFGFSRTQSDFLAFNFRFVIAQLHRCHQIVDIIEFRYFNSTDEMNIIHVRNISLCPTFLCMLNENRKSTIEYDFHVSALNHATKSNSQLRNLLFPFARQM